MKHVAVIYYFSLKVTSNMLYYILHNTSLGNNIIVLCYFSNTLLMQSNYPLDITSIRNVVTLLLH